jgi:hypothetical protein
MHEPRCRQVRDAYTPGVGKLGSILGWQRGLGTLALVLAPFACGTKPDKTGSKAEGDVGGAAGGGVGGVSGTQAHGDISGSGPDLTVGATNSGPIENKGFGGAGGEATCAGEEHPAELVPIDMYVMLDRSLSMNGATSTGDTKWQAITDALEAFVSDASSDGIGVGIQFFPANLPCTNDSDCGGGTCYIKACRLSRNSGTTLPGLVPCVRDADCPASGDTCEPLGGCGDQSCVSVGSTCGNDIDCTALTSGVCASQTVCTLSDYTTPVVPIGALPGNKQAVIDALDLYSPSPSPFGLTPTGPALQGAITYAQAWGAAHPARKAIVVLATDGAPTGGCSPSRRAEIAALASVGAGATVPVQTYTIGVFSSEDPSNPDNSEGPDNIRAIAAAGKGQAFVLSDQGDVAAQFIDALNTVRGHGLACEFQIPESMAGKDVDYGRVNVEFTPKAGAEAEVIPYLDDAKLCDKQGGWYYTTESGSSTPNGIVACGATCDRLMGSVTGNVNIKVGCDTVRRDPVE